MLKFAEISDDLYLDDLITGDENFEQVPSLNGTAIKMFHEIGSKVYKWHSNFPALERKELVNVTDQTFTK